MPTRPIIAIGYGAHRKWNLVPRALAVTLPRHGADHERDRSEPHPRVVIVGGGFGGLSAAKALAGQPFDVTLIDRNNHHLFQPLLYQVATAGAVAGRHRFADPRHPRQPAQHHGHAGRGVGRRYRAQGGDRRRPAGRLRLSGARDRRAARLFRSRRLGRVRAGSEDDRRRHLSAPPHPARLRARRERNRRRGAAPADDLRRDRRRPDRRRDGRRHRRARQARACRRFPFDRSARRPHHPGRGRAAGADAVRPRRCPTPRAARWSSSASRCGSARP